MQTKRVRFLKYFNRARVFVAIEIDTMFVFLVTLLAPYFAFTFSALVTPGIGLLTSIIISTSITYLYIKIKNDYPKGYLKHLLYVNHLYRVNIKKYHEEKERMDVDPEEYYPQSNITYFME